MPISPDSSFIIAELILAEVDIQLQKKCPWLRGMRSMVDAYEFAVESRDQAETAVGLLTEVLSNFQLSLNRDKTIVDTLPIPLEPVWINELQALPLRQKTKQQSRDIVRLFDKAFELVQQYPNRPVLRYVMGRFGKVAIERENWSLYQDLLFQCMTVEPGTTIQGLTEIVKYAEPENPVSATVADTFTELLVMHCKLSRKNEIAWLLWAALVLRVQIEGETMAAVQQIIDPVVALLLLHAEQLHLCAERIDTTVWEPLMTADELYGENWLLAYEALVRKWLPSQNDYVEKDPLFKQLAEAQIRFYDEGAIDNPRASGAPPSLGIAPVFYAD